MYVAVLNYVNNWFQYVTFRKCEVKVRFNFDNFPDVKFVLKFHMFIAFNV